MCHHTDDTVHPPTHPPTIALNNKAPGAYTMVTNPTSYQRVYEEPVAFAAGSLTPGIATVTVRAYWSAERKDIQTTDWDLATLNQHGGDYVTMGIVGYLQSPQLNGSWWSSLAQTPLQQSYSHGREDVFTGRSKPPLATESLLEATDGSYRPPSKASKVV